MTALATIYLNGAILMSADSLEIELDSYETRNIIGTAQAQKLFLIQKSGTGISVSGYSRWEEKTIGEILKEFACSADFTQRSQADIANNLAQFLSRYYPEMRTRFHLCGFDGSEPLVVELEYRERADWKLTRKNIEADGRMANSILTLCEWETARFIRFHSPDFESLSVREALEFLTKFFEVEINVVTRTKSPPDVGGPIDVLVMLPGGQWFESVKSLEEAVLD
jgi:hypothetical protein